MRYRRVRRSEEVSIASPEAILEDLKSVLAMSWTELMLLAQRRRVAVDAAAEAASSR